MQRGEPRKVPVSQDPVTPAVAAFWAWWAAEHRKIEAALAAGDPAYQSELTAAVQRIHPGLQWEIDAGHGAHQLVVSAAGRAEPRSAAARWLLAAPAERSDWTFHATRRPDPRALTLRLVLDEATGKLDLPELTVAVTEDDDARRVHLAVHHERFTALPEAKSVNIAYLALDWALGEEDVQRWVGRVTAVAERPDGAVPIAGLAGAVADFAARHPRGFALVQGTVEGLPLTAVVQVPLSPVDFPLYDQHIAVSVSYTTMTAGRMPTGTSRERIQAFDDALAALVGEDAVLAAAVSHDGRRVFHYYADPLGDVAERLAAWRHGWTEGEVDIVAELDPAWRAVRPFQP